MQKGQLFSLDFIISMVAVTAAIALLIHSIEVNAYSQKEQQLQDELKQVAETAADLLVASKDTTCIIQGTDSHLVNCINSTAGDGVLKPLFPKDGYGYQICGNTVKLYCDSYTGGDFYEATRSVVEWAGPLNKADLENCMRGTGVCPLSESIVKIRVWKI